LARIADDVINTDALVVGAGIAGCLAAIELDNCNVYTTVVSKGPFAKSGSSVMSTGVMQAALGHIDSQDNPGEHLKDTIISGKYLNDQNLVEVLCHESIPRVSDFEQIGVAFSRTANGRVHQAITGGIRFPRAIQALGDWGGVHIMNTLRKEIMKRGISVLSEVVVTKILTSGNTVNGATALDIKSGAFIVFKTKAIILATGGAGQVYAISGAPVHNTGDGYALAYRAGAELLDMEFVHWHPTLLAYPESRKGTLITGSTRAYGAKFFNVKGERFMVKYAPQYLELASDDIISRAIYKEILEGRGTQHNGVFLDCTYVPQKYRVFFNQTYGMLKETGIDIWKEPIEVTVGCVITLGGLRIACDTSTTLKGLFACGETTGGVHGAGYLGGNSLTDCAVFGCRAGKHAAKFVADTSNLKLNLKQVEVEKERILRFFGRKDWMHPAKIKEKLQMIMWEKVGVERSGNKLKQAIKEIEKIRTKDLPKVGVPDGSRRYNSILVQALELYNLVDVAEMMARSALFRKESRGSHYRVDYPDKNDGKWLMHVVIKNEGNKMKISKIPLS
jgi:fumarate reductase (CoM/CoB) subunit A